MGRWDLGLLARAAEAEVVGGTLPSAVGAIGTDTRSLSPHALFVALRGANFDGHDYVRAAVSSGAVAVCVDAQAAASLADLPVPRLVVDDTLRALGDFAHVVRGLHEGPVLAVTGSNGKTTTKELLAAALSPRGAVHKTSGNLNNLIGVPQTLFAWPQEAWAAVVEMGMNAPGEIARLTEIAAPQVGLITNVARAHLEGLGTLRDVALAKGELFAGLGADAVAIVNTDDATLREVALPLVRAGRSITFGRGEGADVRVISAETTEHGLAVKLRVGRDVLEGALPLAGVHNALNAAGAIAAAMAVNVPPDAALAAMGRVVLPPGRLCVRGPTPRGVFVVDDTYNANPDSMVAAFAAFAELARGRRVAALGSMLELGPTAASLHREVGEAAGRSGIEWVLGFGDGGEALCDGARTAGAKSAAYADMSALCAHLDVELQPGDWVLCKGSRGSHMERVVAHLTGEAR